MLEGVHHGVLFGKHLETRVGPGIGVGQVQLLSVCVEVSHNHNLPSFAEIQDLRGKGLLEELVVVSAIIGAMNPNDEGVVPVLPVQINDNIFVWKVGERVQHLDMAPHCITKEDSSATHPRAGPPPQAVVHNYKARGSEESPLLCEEFGLREDQKV